mgnify:CR=1 FL=1
MLLLYMQDSFLSKFISFIKEHAGLTMSGGKRKSRNKKKSKTKRNRKIKTPSYLSIFPDKSPQLQKEGEITKLTPFTTKNVAIRDENNREFNGIINDRLAYRRAPRGQDVQDFSDILYGPTVIRITKKNYRKLKKNDRVYYNRGSVVLRGPFIFEGHRRGPELLFRVKDTVYEKYYKFSIMVDRLTDETLYMVVGPKRKTKSVRSKRAKRTLKR